ncbi:MAG: 4Fe-4S dicluster domain-containing protein [Elusimicrobia bacterium]|nr:4Fe-4S dicluster domain-containing protein [Elusimicrobiota bacterium]
MSDRDATDPGPQGISRRRFLSLMAASAAAAATSACGSPDQDTIVPYTKKPADVVPGVANYYASTYQEGRVPYGVLVKAREGRPIHIDGNDEHPIFAGKTSPRAQAEIMGLYDPQRLREPRLGGSPAAWEKAQARVADALKAAARGRRPVLLLTSAVISPSRRDAIAALRRALPGLEHVAWEPALSATERAAADSLYGTAAAPRYRVERAKVLALFEADLLGSMDSAVPAVAGFARGRTPSRPGEPMSRLYAFESRLSLTGSKADVRVPVRPSAAAPLAFATARILRERHGFALPGGLSARDLEPFRPAAVAERWGADPAVLSALARDLARAGRDGLAVAGPSLPEEAHAAAALLNAMIGAEGRTLETDRAVEPGPLASPTEMARLTRELAAGKYAAAVFWETNPSYAVSDADGFNAALDKTPLKVCLGLREDETSRRCDVVLPISHWLESWGDYEAATDLLGLQQPLIRPLYGTKQGEEIVLGWAKELGASVETDPRASLMARWRREVYPAGTLASFEAYWTAAVHDGVLRRDVPARAPRRLRGGAVASAAKKAASARPGSLELLVEPDYKMWDGRYAGNGWLQELPDPVTKVCWGNFLAVSAADARSLGLSDGDVVSVRVGRRGVELPVLVQPGQAPGAVFAALGYGREGDVAAGCGASVYPLVADDGSAPFHRTEIAVSKTGARRPLVRSQTEFDLHGRDVVRVWAPGEYARKAKTPEYAEELATLNDDPRWGDHKWGMAIDLSACVGCAGCQVACQSENNIPVVGPEQVARGRIMHWIRSDVYYVGAPENPRVAHGVMLCQQCDDAPCEPVCPVAASVHSEEGLNEQVYNRCIGVRYCEANCPYSARRFNFFDYTSAIDDPAELAFNPEVSVRPRGVAEKCTFCVQRIRNGEQIAKDHGRPVRDGEIRPACAAACPAEAIVFGDLKDPNSRVSKLARSDRGYKVLHELGTRPAVTYMAELTNPAEEAKI